MSITFSFQSCPEIMSHIQKLINFWVRTEFVQESIGDACSGAFLRVGLGGPVPENIKKNLL